MKTLLNKTKQFYKKNGCMHIYKHSLNVANKAIELANLYYCNDDIINRVYIAGLLHDIGGIYPSSQRIDVAKQFHIELLDEEYIFPLIIHQKLSRYLAKEIFKIYDIRILDSIECHTTLRSQYQIEDLIVFLADKIAWDQDYVPPYLDALLKKLDDSLEEATLCYIDYILANGIKVMHPWLLIAREELEQNVKNGKIITKKVL